MGNVLPHDSRLQAVIGRARLRITGFTLPELLVALGIVSVLAAFVAPSFSNMIASQRIRTGATDLHLALTKARSEAKKRNMNIELLPMDGNWNNGWCAGLQGSFNCTNSSAEEPNKIFERNNPVSGAVITGPSSVVYQITGRVRGSTQPVFNFSFAGTDAVACVTVDLSGLPIQKSSSC